MPNKFTRAILGLRLRQARIENKYTQQDAAAHCKVTRQTISGWERGSSHICVLQLGSLAMLYGKTTDYLIFGIQTVPVNDESMCGRCPNSHGILRRVLVVRRVADGVAL
jgi:transcriptional regulator with XRE-family HTH domain